MGAYVLKSNWGYCVYYLQLFFATYELFKSSQKLKFHFADSKIANISEKKKNTEWKKLKLDH